MVTPFFHPVVIGGSETQIRNTCLKLNKNTKIVADVMTFNFSKTLKPLPYKEIDDMNGIKVIRIPGFSLVPRRLRSPRINFLINTIPYKFKSELKDYDILHFHNETDLSFPTFSFNIRKPKIFHLRCLSVSYPIFKENYICKLLLKNSADIFIAQSKYISNLLADLGIPKTKIKIVYSGVDVSFFHPGKMERDENLLLFVGRIEENKGLHIILKSLQLVYKPIKLVIIGPLVGRPKYHKKIFGLIMDINRRNFHEVTYLGPKQPREIIEFYQTATIVVVPSLAESFSNVILEALACGTPVIASNVGGTPEVIDNNENGILVPSNDHEKLADAINFLLSDKSLGEKLGREGRKCVIEKFSIEATVNKLINIYHNIIC